jgi:hypothetical protein
MRLSAWQFSRLNLADWLAGPAAHRHNFAGDLHDLRGTPSVAAWAVASNNLHLSYLLCARRHPSQIN